MDFLKKFSKENTKKDEEFEITLHDKITAHQTERRRLTGRITADFRPHDYVLTIKTANRYQIRKNFTCKNPLKTPPETSDFIFEINVGEGRTRHRKTECQ